MTFCLRKQRSGSFQWEMEEAVGEGAARLHGSTAGREGSGGEGERGAPSVLPRRGGDAGTHRGDARGPRSHLLPGGLRDREALRGTRGPAEGTGLCQPGRHRAHSRAISQRMSVPVARVPPPTANTLRSPSTSSRGPGARLRGRHHARFPHRRPPARSPPRPAARRASPQHAQTSPPRHTPFSGPQVPPLARGARSGNSPRPRGAPHGSGPLPTAGSAFAVPPACPARTPQRPARRAPAPRLGGPAAGPRAAGSQPRTQSSASAPQGSRPRGQMRGLKPSGRPQHASRRAPSPAAGP